MGVQGRGEGGAGEADEVEALGTPQIAGRRWVVEPPYKSQMLYVSPMPWMVVAVALPQPVLDCLLRNQHIG